MGVDCRKMRLLLIVAILFARIAAQGMGNGVSKGRAPKLCLEKQAPIYHE